MAKRKTISALFADIKGSMELIRDLDPEEARTVIAPVHPAPPADRVFPIASDREREAPRPIYG
jgi:hypothetical protein